MATPDPADPAAVVPGPRPRISKWLILVGVVAVLAGLLFGYDQGVISGALRGIEHTFAVGTLAVEIVTSWVTLGALVGALVAGALADRAGRRWTIIIAAGLFVVGATIETLAPATWVLVTGRLVVGLGVGVASVAAPLYAAEMAPARLRGRFVSLYQLAITVGIFVAYLVDQLLAAGNWWRLMLGISVLPGLLLILAVFPLPDSAVWYLKSGRRAQAAVALYKMQPVENVAAEMDEIQAHMRARPASWREILARKWREPLVLGLGLAMFQQFTGVNAIIYYANMVFAAAGFHTPQAQTAATTWSIGAVNLLFTVVAVGYVDRLGRRPLLLTGLVGMGIALLVISLCFRQLREISTVASQPSNRPSDAGVIMLVAMMVFIASFAFSLGPMVWTVINEIYPGDIRGPGVAVATAVNWGAAWLVTQFFLSLTEWIGESGTFGVFAGVCAVAFVFVWRLLPETKGKSLVEIQQMWTERRSHGRPR